MSRSPLDLAEVAYKAYGDWADWTNHAGNAMPSWEALPEPQRNAWVAAVGAVEQALLRPRGGPRSAYEASHPVMAHRSAATAAAAPAGTCATGCACGPDTGGRA